MTQRQIKFRVWDYEARKMFTPVSIPNYIPDDESHYEYLQFTGLKDKNGKEVYEGDIVRNENDRNPNQQIIFAKGMFCLDDEDSPLWKYNPKNFWEIIGNVWETPELLK